MHGCGSRALRSCRAFSVSGAIPSTAAASTLPGVQFVSIASFASPARQTSRESTSNCGRSGAGSTSSTIPQGIRSGCSWLASITCRADIEQHVAEWDKWAQALCPVTGALWFRPVHTVAGPVQEPSMVLMQAVPGVKKCSSFPKLLIPPKKRKSQF